MLRIIQQAFDRPFVPVGRRIVVGRGDLVGSRRQADQVEGQSAQQDEPRSLGLRPKSELFVLAGDERIDRIPDPLAPLHFGNRRTHQRAERPVVPRVGFGLFVGRRRSAGGDPSPQQRDLPGGQRLAFVLGRHPIGNIDRCDSIQQQARLRISRRDRRPRVSSQQDRPARIEPQPALLLECAVASVTARTQKRLDLCRIIDRRSGRSLIGFDRLILGNAWADHQSTGRQTDARDQD